MLEMSQGGPYPSPTKSAVSWKSTFAMKSGMSRCSTADMSQWDRVQVPPTDWRIPFTTSALDIGIKYGIGYGLYMAVSDGFVIGSQPSMPQQCLPTDRQTKRTKHMVHNLVCHFTSFV